jgi:hypothetical protein
MSPKLLESLLTDRALGEHSIEVEALLDAYLRDHPEAQSLSDQIMQTVEVAKQVLNDNTEIRLHEFPLDYMRRVEKRACHSRRLRKGAALAASLLLGIGLGMLSQFRAANPIASQGSVAAYQEVPQPYVSSAAKGSRVGFWSSRRFYDRYTRQKYQTSPASDSAIIERIRQRYHQSLFGDAS